MNRREVLASAIAALLPIPAARALTFKGVEIWWDEAPQPDSTPVYFMNENGLQRLEQAWRACMSDTRDLPNWIQISEE